MIRFVYCPLYWKRCYNLWPGILGMGHCGILLHL
jgi:hypothetical protein